MSFQKRRFKELLVLVAVLGIFGIAVGQEPITVSYQGRQIRFSVAERPYYMGRVAMISVKPVCLAMGADVRRGRDAIHWTIRRGDDRIDYAFGDRWFIFNGARIELSAQPEGRGETLFAPFDFFERFSGGALELNADNSNHRVPEIIFRRRILRFKREDSPVRIAGSVYVALHATTLFIGARVDMSSDKVHLTITRALDHVSYEQGMHTYVFNGSVKNLRSGSIFRGKDIFVPIELFQALVGDELRSR